MDNQKGIFFSEVAVLDTAAVQLYICCNQTKAPAKKFRSVTTGGEQLPVWHQLSSHMSRKIETSKFEMPLKAPLSCLDNHQLLIKILNARCECEGTVAGSLVL